jgi:hypothetical protein
LAALNLGVSMSRQIAVNLNNKGVLCLKEGKLVEAFDLFRTALMNVSGDVNCPQESFRWSQTQPASSAPAAIYSVTNNSSSTPFMYSSGINLLSSITAYSLEPSVNDTVFSSIVIFNLAIVYHLKGFECSGSQSRIQFFKAMSLYQKSYMLLVAVGVLKTATGNAVVDMVCMSVFNNLAEVCFELSDFSECQRYFVCLMRFLDSVATYIYDDDHTSSMLFQAKINFLLNATLLQEPFLAAAA